MSNMVEVIVAICAIVGAYALLAVIGLFPSTTLPLVLAIGGAVGAFLYGRYGRRRL
jgi:predicted RND superfamily exporter protein